MPLPNLRSRSLPLAGAAIGVVWVGTQIVADMLVLGTPDPVAHPAAVQQTLLDHQPAALTTIFGAVSLAVLVVFFGAALRRSLGDSALATASFGGAVLLAVALTSDAVGGFAVLAAAVHHDTRAVTILGYATTTAWPLLSVAGGVFLLATGTAALRAGVLPGWLARTTVGLGVLALLGPGALVFWLAAPLWFAAVGLTMEPGRELAGDPQPVVA